MKKALIYILFTSLEARFKSRLLKARFNLHVCACTHACTYVWADVGQIREFVLLRLWDFGLGEIVDVEFRNCWRKDYGLLGGCYLVEENMHGFRALICERKDLIMGCKLEGKERILWYSRVLRTIPVNSTTRKKKEKREEMNERNNKANVLQYSKHSIFCWSPPNLLWVYWLFVVLVVLGLLVWLVN